MSRTAAGLLIAGMLIAVIGATAKCSHGKPRVTEVQQDEVSSARKRWRKVRRYRYARARAQVRAVAQAQAEPEPPPIEAAPEPESEPDGPLMVSYWPPLDDDAPATFAERFAGAER